jgi:hypothetical protein
VLIMRRVTNPPGIVHNESRCGSRADRRAERCS